ncbi:MAG TPA: GAF domain-containing protein [Anaerolineales bacterium]|nr:GAF domain-containing protein [Anaerolineales bacterium]
MLKSLTKIFAPPIFPEDEDKTRKARYANAISLTFIVIVLAFEIGTRALRSYTDIGIADLILIFLAIANLTGWILLKRGHLQFTSILLVALIWIASNGIALGGFGIRDTSYLANFSTVVMAGLLLGWRASVVVTVASILSAFGLAYAEETGLIENRSYSAVAFVQDITLIFSLNTVLIYLLISGLENEVKRSKTSLQELEKTNIHLHNAQTDLEQHTAELRQRGLELEAANEQIQRRAAQFEALAQVTQAITSVRDLRELLPRIATVISEKFGFYHVGLFLLDGAREYAVLSATNSEGGRQMLERKHRLRVGEQGIVGNVTATGKPRIAMDVGADAVFFDNPELPDTHSEMALPLRSGGLVVGALDVQSTETGVFQDEDIQMLILLADQVSLAIENARLFEETRNALAEAEAVGRQFTREVWSNLPSDQNLFGYQYTLVGSSPLEKPIELRDSGHGMDKQKEEGRVTVPIELRGEAIGTLIVQTPTTEILSQDQIDLIKAVAERVALAAENARLFEETTRRAERERLVSDITGKIRSVNDPQIMIQTAMEELRNALGASRVEVIPQTTNGKEQPNHKTEDV